MFSSSEVVELFEETQEQYDSVIRRSVREGMLVFRIKEQTPEVRKSCARRVREHMERRIKQRILRGERPRKGGRPPTMWMKVAKEMGVDLGL